MQLPPPLRPRAFSRSTCALLALTVALLLTPLDSRAQFLGAGVDAFDSDMSVTVSRVLWLHDVQLEGDDTDGHVDTLARFAGSGNIVFQR